MCIQMCSLKNAIMVRTHEFTVHKIWHGKIKLVLFFKKLFSILKVTQNFKKWREPPPPPKIK